MARIQPTQRRKKQSSTQTLLMMCVLSIAVLGSMVVTDVFSISSLNKPAPMSLGGVALGSNLDDLQATQPNTTQNTTPFGAITMTFADQEAAYRIWYGQDGKQKVAYKARQSRVIEGVSEDEFVGGLSVKYGQPSLSSCSRRITDGIRDCHFSWWVPDNVRIDLNSRQIKNTVAPSLQITLQITDTRMNMRLQSKSVRKGTSVHMF